MRATLLSRQRRLRLVLHLCFVLCDFRALRPAPRPGNQRGGRIDLRKLAANRLQTVEQTPPGAPEAIHRHPSLKSQRRDSNPRPADYKSAALPTELRWPAIPIEPPESLA
jgi:hypothetical protein